MRILHTADWHLNDRLGRIDRTADLRRGVEQIAQYCESEKIDVLLIAGDLFSELARPDALRETVKHWQEQFSSFLARGGTILAVTGNHDSETFCQTLRHAMTLAAGDPHDGRLQPGRFFLATKPTFVSLRDPSNSFDVSFALMPWPTATQYPAAVAGATTPEDKIQKLQKAFQQALKSMPKSKPAILVSHINVSGANVGDNYFRINPQENVTIEAADLASQFCYVALGHIHKSQQVGSFEHVRYSGSINQMDLGEQYDVKSCVVIEVGTHGLVKPIKLLPMNMNQIKSIAIVDPEIDMPKLKEENSGSKDDLVKLTIRYDAGRHRLEDVLSETTKIFPRWYVRDWKEISALSPSTMSIQELDRSKGFAETVREYVTQELIQYPLEEQADYFQKLDELLNMEPA